MRAVVVILAYQFWLIVAFLVSIYIEYEAASTAVITSATGKRICMLL
jgi:hypothetical protein